MSDVCLLDKKSDAEKEETKTVNLALKKSQGSQSEETDSRRRLVNSVIFVRLAVVIAAVIA